MQTLAHTKPIRIALIGSRKLEEIPAYKQYISIYYDYCYQLAKAGVVMTSGLCGKGPDSIAQKAYAQAIQEGLADVSQYEVYVYDQKEINKSVLPFKSHTMVMPDHLKEKRMEFLRYVMTPSHIEACGPYALGMHQRNVHQIMGLELNDPVDAVFTWCMLDKEGKPMGGTATAYNLAVLRGIPVINLFNMDLEYVTSQLNILLGAKL